jgi:putative Mg2+ transporter-C (MgtC) family protein
MHATVTWPEIAIRLILTVLTAGAVGLNRDEHGRPAGLRTNLLVALAACVAMIQANILVISTGKSSDSFVVMDIMRLPLGILSGIGFIGAGAIIKRGEITVGLTTAATLWFVTVMGLCFGGGQIGLGLAAFGLCFVILAGLKRFEDVMSKEQSATLSMAVHEQDGEKKEVEELLTGSGIQLETSGISYDATGFKVITWNLHWRGKGQHNGLPAAIQELSTRREVQRLEFRRQS